MREIPKRLLALLRQLLPQQKNTGSGAVQVGKAGGDVTVVNLTQHTTQHITQHLPHLPNLHAGSGLSPAAPVRRQANPAQREVLYLMAQLAEREGAVLDFMQREFGTRRVVDLGDAQLFRVRRYVEVTLKGGR